MAREALKEKGYAVLEASAGRVALVIGERHMGPIDLVLTDIVTTDMSGHVLAERLAQFRPEIRVLYMSGYVGEIYSVIPQGQALLSKPFTPEMLVAEVRNIKCTVCVGGRLKNGDVECPMTRHLD